MGKGSATVGYRYRHALFDVWAQNVDKLHRYLAGGKNTDVPLIEANTVAQINKPDLWGGDKEEGGMVGPLHVMFGKDDQPINATIGSLLGGRQTGNRGWFSTFFHGAFGSYIPNPKTRAVLAERLHRGWPGDEAWYPETVAIPLGPATENTVVIDPDVVLDSADTSLDGSDGGFDFYVPPGATIIIELGPSSDGWSFTPADDYQPENYGYLTWWNHFGIVNLDTSTMVGTYWPERFSTAAQARAAHALSKVEIYSASGGNFRLFLRDATIDDNRGEGAYRVSYSYVGSAINAMNPAHIIRYVLTVKKGVPDAMLSEPSFTYAADFLFAEGFGLCETFDPDAETPEDFIRRICDIIGACCTQSRADGLIYLDLLRNDYVKDDLPKLVDDDILDWLDEMSVPSEVANSMQIGWRDVLVDGGLDRITPPAKALGLIRTHGREQGMVIDMRGIPFEPIAMRVCKRELDSRSKPLHRLTLSTFRRHVSLRPGMAMVIDCPKFGIVDMVVRVGQIDIGSPTDEKMQWALLQDVFDLPATTGLDPTTIYDPDTSPTGASFTSAEEAPYVALLAFFGPEVTAEVDEAAGYLMTGSSAPESGFNYGVYSRLLSEVYERRATADFAPSAVATGGVGPLTTTVQLEEPRLLERVIVGTWAKWENEFIRVEGIDDDLVLTMARGCLDTVPQIHFGGTVILFLADTPGSDDREYTVGEELRVKLPARRSGGEQSLDDVGEHEVTYAQRQFRPYPPGGLMLNELPFYDSGAIDAGGGGGGGGPTTPPAPPALAPGGGQASTEVGPNGGFPDDAENPIPLPTVFDADVMPGGGFDTEADLDQWGTKNGEPLPFGWSTVDGRARYVGRCTQGSSGIEFVHESAYLHALQLRLPHSTIPRYEVTITADVYCAPNTKVSIGVAYGLAGGVMQYLDVSTPETFMASTPSSHTTSGPLAVSIPLQGNLTPQWVVVPVLTVSSASIYEEVEAWFDNVTFSIHEVPTPSTVFVPDHIDFDAGLTGWLQRPAMTGTSIDPTVVASGGELAVTINSSVFRYVTLINEDPITTADLAGKFIGVSGELWSDDPTVIRGIPYGGICLGLASKYVPTGEYTFFPLTAFLRGDWTPQEGWRTVGITLDRTWHAAAQVSHHAGTYVPVTSKVRNLQVRVTDGEVD